MGKWREREAGLRSYFGGGVVNCAVCGKMIPREIWEAEVVGQLLPFCDDGCERLYIEYWLSKHRHNQTASENEE